MQLLNNFFIYDNKNCNIKGENMFTIKNLQHITQEQKELLLNQVFGMTSDGDFEE